MINYINKKYQENQIKKWEPVEWKPIKGQWIDFFVRQDCRVAICNLVAVKTNLISNIIGKLEGGLSHTVLLMYEPEMHLILNEGEKEKLNKNLKFYYINPPKIEDIKIWVWGSADETGMNYYDFSVLQNREKWIYKIPHYNLNYNSIIHSMNDYIAKPYDGTGLLFWLLYKKVSKLFGFFDDKKSAFCSEYVYDMLRNCAGYVCADEDNPSPYMIHNRMKSNTIFHPIVM